MDKTQQFFDPYNFNAQQPINQNMQNPEMINPNLDAMSPVMYYEQQYMYYRYLNQMLDYKIRLKEYEKLNKDNK